MPDIHQLPPLDLHMPAQRGCCDICRFGAVAAVRAEPGGQRHIHHEQIENGYKATKQQGKKRGRTKRAAGGYSHRDGSFINIMKPVTHPV
ncbi:hypothetical protein M2324_001774 [Rhodovulum sulfidophilum]|uniref:hypothetical protein n=1 Tax=Rhodovulum sulfidophilum TaxID=35806 RepID=UPI0005A69A7E|nr:hypothetical protein [Rhodovulum sulfidophilum]ANB32639.1 hypothetical protein A6W98_00220 [Rhodovulum sulfidophilum DSM 1374]ANB36488.1 hypothetical protein A6024_00205 [Rhodovulum sulfidophilum]MCW2303381.1 hypothetical protein [Rhodovulum sulfidophilum]